QQGERPLTAVEVSLVSLPTLVKPAEPAKPIEPAKVMVPKPAPAPAPAPAPVVKAMTSIAVPSSTPPKGEKRRDMMQDLDLPPDAPKFGDLSPATKTVAQPQQMAQVPEIPRIPDVTQDPVVKAPQRAAVSDD